MARLPPGWRRSVCPDCGREIIVAPGETDLNTMVTPQVRLDAAAVRLFIADEVAEAALRDCYAPHAATCDYRQRSQR